MVHSLLSWFIERRDYETRKTSIKGTNKDAKIYVGKFTMHDLLYLRSFTKDELRNRNRLYWLVVQSVVNSSCIQDQKVYKNVQQRTL